MRRMPRPPQEEVTIHCPVYQCGHEYKAYGWDTPCPVCNISEGEIGRYGTNDRNRIYDLRIKWPNGAK